MPGRTARSPASSSALNSRIPYRPARPPSCGDLLALRDSARALLAAEAASAEDTPEIAGLRAELGRRYDRYLAAYGPLNRFSLRRTGRTDPATGEPVLARIRPRQGGFAADPFAPLVYALEQFDPVGQRAAKAAIFRERVIAPRAPRLGADTPADALAICLDARGEPRLDEIARLLGTTEDDARAQLGTLVFDDPGTGRLVPAAEYLSGQVREKLRQAERAAEDDSRFAVNVTELRRVIPPDLTPGEIDARLGAAWIDATYVQQFLREILDDPRLRVEHPGGQIWAVRGDPHTVLPAPPGAPAATRHRSSRRPCWNSAASRSVTPSPMRTARTVRSSTPTRRWPRRRKRPNWPNGSRTGPGRTRPARPRWPAPTTTGSTAWCCAATTTPSCPCPAWP